MTEPRMVTPNFKDPKKKSPQKERQNWSEQCDDLARKIARSRGRCENCGKTSDLQWAHGFPRDYRNTRWLEEANFCLCRGCHKFYTHRPLQWDDWLQDRWGEEKYWRLRRLALSTDKAHKPNTKELVKVLRERWERIQRAYGEAS